MITAMSLFISFTFFNQKMPSLPVLMLLLKFMSSSIRSNFFSANKARMFSGFFSVVTSFTSVFNSIFTAVSTSVSSSTTSTLAFFKFMVIFFERFSGGPFLSFLLQCYHISILFLQTSFYRIPATTFAIIF